MPGSTLRKVRLCGCVLLSHLLVPVLPVKIAASVGLIDVFAWPCLGGCCNLYEQWMAGVCCMWARICH